MPNALLVSDVLQFKFFCHDNTQNGINVVGYQVTATVGGTVTDQDAADQVGAFMAVLYKAYLPTVCTYAGCRVQVIRPVLKPAVTSTLGNGVGVTASDPLPPQVAFLLSPRTNVAGRRGRGRTYLPFWAESHNDAAGTPTAAAIILGQAWGTGAFSAFNVTVGGNNATLTPVIVSQTPPITQIPITSFLARNRWGTQRRRSLLNKPDVLGP